MPTVMKEEMVQQASVSEGFYQFLDLWPYEDPHNPQHKKKTNSSN